MNSRVNLNVEINIDEAFCQLNHIDKKEFLEEHLTDLSEKEIMDIIIYSLDAETILDYIDEDVIKGYLKSH